MHPGKDRSQELFKQYYPGTIPEISRKFPGNVLKISRKCLGNYQKFTGILPEMLWKIPGTFPEMSRKFPGKRYQKTLRNILMILELRCALTSSGNSASICNPMMRFKKTGLKINLTFLSLDSRFSSFPAGSG